jgi:hypothetical protein
LCSVRSLFFFLFSRPLSVVFAYIESIICHRFSESFQVLLFPLSLWRVISSSCHQSFTDIFLGKQPFRKLCVSLHTWGGKEVKLVLNLFLSLKGHAFGVKPSGLRVEDLFLSFSLARKGHLLLIN